MKSTRNTSFDKRIDSEYDLIILGGARDQQLLRGQFAAEGKWVRVLFAVQNSPSIAGVLPFDMHGGGSCLT
jgi:hypothetical protein